MKTYLKLMVSTAILLFISSICRAQILKNIGNRVKQKAEQRANQKIDNTIDKGLDKAEGTGQKKDESTTTSPKTTGDNKTVSDAGSTNNTTISKTTPELKTYSKFDFVPGDKIIVFDDFTQESIGDFPSKWNTNSSGEIVTVEGQTGRWLMVNKKGRFIPEYVGELPDNFTLQFNLMSNEKFYYYSPGLELYFLNGSNGKEIPKDYFISEQKRSGIKFYFHPVSPGNKSGEAGVEVWEDGQKKMDNEVTTPQFNSHAGNNKVSVSIWRQKQRIRVYVNEEKVFDLPRVFSENKKYATTMFQLPKKMANDQDRFLINNFKFAIGAPDTRNKLITEGKFITRGILFDPGSDKIKPESYGTLKDIATVLKENAGLKTRIIGHTDADGNDADNLTLSKRRAESVKTSLVREFEIDGARLETDGKGESQPADKNTTQEAKANNRRVEFVKL